MMDTWQKIWRVVSGVISVASFGYLVYRLAIFDWGTLTSAGLGGGLSEGGMSAGGMNEGGRWWFIGIAALFFPVPVLIEAWRWQVMMRGLSNLSFRESLRQVLTGLQAGFITPYRVGEYPARVAEAGAKADVQWGNWRVWLRDWRKWLQVIGITALKYIIWGSQLWCVLWAFGIELGFVDAVSAIAVYYFCISVFPSVPIADIGVKGGWALLIFGEYGGTAPQLTAVVSIIWGINTILPLLWGYIVACRGGIERRADAQRSQQNREVRSER